MNRFRIAVRGRLKVTRSNGHDGRQITVWLLGPKDGFDIAELPEGLPNAVSVQTLDETETVAAPL